MSGAAVSLTDDQRDLAVMLDALAADRNVVPEDDADMMGGLVAELASLGIWTLGTSEDSGGGGADRATTAVALHRLGMHWPALGWAAVQAHAAIDVLAGRPAELVAGIHAGTEAIAVVDSTSAHVHVQWQGDRLTGTVDRVDAAAEQPHLLILDGDEAHLVAPSATTVTPLQRTGFGGAFTRAVRIDAGTHDVQRITAPTAGDARLRLRLGAAAVAAGIARAAAESAQQYATNRRQFGDALIAIPTVRQSVLDQRGRAAILQLLVMGGGEDLASARATARKACDEAIDIAAAALQSHGGYGYLAEYPAERRLRDAVSLRAAADAQAEPSVSAR